MGNTGCTGKVAEIILVGTRDRKERRSVYFRPRAQSKFAGVGIIRGCVLKPELCVSSIELCIRGRVVTEPGSFIEEGS